MADDTDNSPGQIISPGDNPEQNPSPPQPQASEVSVPLNRETPSPVAPTSTQLPPEPVPQPQPQPQPQAQEPVQQPAPVQPTEQSAPVSQPETPPVVVSNPEPAVDDTAPSPYAMPQEDTHQQEPDVPAVGAITWTASEYVAHHKSSAWYLLLAVGALSVAGLVFWVTGGDIISTAVIILVAIVFGMYAGRKPQVQEYGVSAEGVAIGQKTYSYRDLKSFAVIDEGPFSSISFMPLKRFMPIISIYYDPADEQRIVDVLSAHLPMEQRGHDAIDRLMKKIRF